MLGHCEENESTIFFYPCVLHGLLDLSEEYNVYVKGEKRNASEKYIIRIQSMSEFPLCFVEIIEVVEAFVIGV